MRERVALEEGLKHLADYGRPQLWVKAVREVLAAVDRAAVNHDAVREALRVGHVKGLSYHEESDPPPPEDPPESLLDQLDDELP